MDFSKARAALARSALDFALNAFWVAVVGVAVTIPAVLWAQLAARQGLLYAFLGASGAFATMLLVTAAIARLQRRSTAVRRQGRKGLLNHIYDRDRATAALISSMATITAETAAIGRLTQRGALEADGINRRGGQKQTQRAYKHAGKVAGAIAKRTAVMRIHATRYADNSDLFMESVISWLDWMAAHDTTLDDEKGFIAVVAALGAAVAGAKLGTLGFRQAVERNRLLSDQMDVAGEGLVSVLDTILQTMSDTEAFCDRICTRFKH